MKFLILIISLLIIKHSSGNLPINTIHEKLWSKIEGQLEDLTKKLELQKNKIISLKGLLHMEAINITHLPELNDENDNDPYAFGIVSNIKVEFELLKLFHTQVKTFNIAQEDKNEIKQTLLQSLKEQRENSINIDSQNKIFKFNHLNERCTSKTNFIYEFFPVNGTKINFKLHAANDGHIALAHNPVHSAPIYEVILGGWTNSKSVIRKDFVDLLAEFSHPSILLECEYKGFWIRWDAGVIQAGFEKEEIPFLSYNVPTLYKVNYIGIHTGYGAKGSWIF